MSGRTGRPSASSCAGRDRGGTGSADRPPGEAPDRPGPASARVIAKISAGGETVEEAAEIRRSTGGLLDDAIVYRGRPAATSPLRAVADLRFRRTERVHVEGPVGGDPDRHAARLLGRTGQPLVVPVAVTEGQTDGRKVIAADLILAPLGAGEYLIELTAGRGAETVVRLIAFRVIQ